MPPDLEHPIRNSADMPESGASSTNPDDNLRLEALASFTSKNGKSDISTPDFLNLDNVFTKSTPAFPLPEAAQNNYLKDAIDKGTDDNGNRHYLYGDGTKVTLNNDKTSGTVRYAQGEGKSLEVHFGPKEEDNYHVKSSPATDGGWNYDYSNGRFVHLDKDKTGGYSRTFFDLKDQNKGYREIHWGQGTENNYSFDVTTDENGYTVKSFKDGTTEGISKDGLSGYELLKDGAGRIISKQHWGQTDKDYYSEYYLSDGQVQKMPIPRDYNKLLEIHQSANIEFVEKAKQVLDNLPRSTIELLNAQGTIIVLANSLLDYDRASAMEEARGQPGKVAANADGRFLASKNKILIGEYYHKNALVPQRNAQGQIFYASQMQPVKGASPDENLKTSLYHEIGHAINYCNAVQPQLSNSQEYQQAYNSDLAQLSQSARASFPYVIPGQWVNSAQESACRDELFSELFAARNNAEASTGESADKMKAAFPNTFSQAGEIIKQYSASRLMSKFYTKRQIPEQIAQK